MNFIIFPTSAAELECHKICSTRRGELDFAKGARKDSGRGEAVVTGITRFMGNTCRKMKGKKDGDFFEANRTLAGAKTIRVKIRKNKFNQGCKVN